MNMQTGIACVYCLLPMEIDCLRHMDFLLPIDHHELLFIIIGPPAEGAPWGGAPAEGLRPPRGLGGGGRGGRVPKRFPLQII